MNIGVAKRVQQEERGRALMCNRARPSGDASGDASGDSMRPGPMSADVAGAESRASFKENAHCNADPGISAGDPFREMCYDALDSIRAGKCDATALCAMQIEPEGDIVQLPQLGDLDTLAAFVQTSFAPLIDEFDANSMHDEHDVHLFGKFETLTETFKCKNVSRGVRLCTAEAPSDIKPTGCDKSAALAGFSESGNGFQMLVEKSLVKKRAVCSVCGGKGHNKRSCFHVMNLR